MKRTIWIELAVIAAVALVPFWGSPLLTFLATDAAIWALFAVSLNILVGYTGLVSFGHAAYFGIGGYAAGLLLKSSGLPFLLAFPLAGLAAALAAAVFGFFCVRLTKVYFSMLTLAFAQIAWAVSMKWNSVTGGDQGMSGIPYPDLLGLLDAVPLLGDLGASERYHLLVIVLVGAGLITVRRIMESPFGRILTMIRENPSRAEFVGVNVRAYQLAGFVIAGLFAGLAGALFAIFNRGMYPDLMYWTKSAEVLIMVLLGGMTRFHGPILGAFVLLWLNQEVTAVTEYWSLIVGLTLIAILFFLPGGLVQAVGWLRGRQSRLAGTAMAGAAPRTGGLP